MAGLVIGFLKFDNHCVMKLVLFQYGLTTGIFAIFDLRFQFKFNFWFPLIKSFHIRKNKSIQRS